MLKIFCTDLVVDGKKPQNIQKTQSHMKPSMKIEIYMFLIQEFSLNEWAKLKYVIYLKQIRKVFIYKHH